MLKIQLLGKFAAALDGRPVELPLRAAQSLLAYLALTAGTAHRREQLAGLLWPEADESSAKGNLRHTLWRLRKALGERDYVFADDLTLAFDATADYWLDARVIGQKADASASADGLIQIASVYEGELLPGFYDEWVLLERERLQAAYEARMALLMERLVEVQRWGEVLEWGERWIALGHTPEAAYRALIVAHGSRGDASSAAMAYRRCVEALRTELGVDPSPQTRAAYERWLAQRGGLPSSSSDIPVRALRGYELEERIGAGAFGVVYRAYQPEVERRVAMKVIAPQHANHPDFIRRFEAEARLVAQLEHPHIVPLFDYWREPGGAYLVMRWLPHSLRTLLTKAPFTPLAALQLVEQIASALAAAHRHGIAHLDLKPDNILLDDDGNAYLADFGIARTIEEGRGGEEGISGSLDYVSPEQIKGEAVSVRTDLYGLGLVIYEMVAGRHPFFGSTPDDLIVRHLREPLPDLSELHRDLPEGLNHVVQRATAKNPAERYADVMALLADLRRAVLGERAPTALVEAELPPLVNPYKGLRAFEEADAADFFGREALVKRLVARLASPPGPLSQDESSRFGRGGVAEDDVPPLPPTVLSSSGEGGWGGEARFLAVVGASGCGKSSVAKAGLIPALRRGAVSGSERWFVVTLTPGDRAIKSLETALLSVATRPPAFLLEQLQTNARGLLWAADTVLAGVDGDLLLVIDQFEELFTLVTSEVERAQFLNLLRAAAADPRSRVRVVVTLRADFTDRPLQYPEFGELMRQRTEFVLPLTAEELGRAVTGPAGRVGVRVDDDLLAAIVADVSEEPGALPMLQYALTETFERREDRRLTLEAYHGAGGVSGALARRAEEVYASLDAAGQAAARQMFLRLVTLGEGVEDTRRRVLRGELMALSKLPLTPTLPTPLRFGGLVSLRERESGLPSPSGGGAGGEGGMPSVIDLFGKARLLTFDRDPATHGPTVEVAHEALLREWARLREWLSDSRADVRLQRQLAHAAAEWQSANRDSSFLLSGARLAQFEGWMTGTSLALTSEERAFYEASIAERERRAKDEAERQRRELETAQQLAATERRRADEQTQAITRVRLRNRLIAVAGGIALVLAVVAGIFGFQSNTNAQMAQQNLGAAQVANTQSAANAAIAQANAVTAEAASVLAEQQRNVALDSQATAVQAQMNAEQQAALAFARELDAAAALQLAADPQLSLLLALRAVSVTRAAGLEAPLDVQQTLHNVMPAQRLLWTQNVPYSPIKIAYSADGKRITVVDASSSVTATTYIIDADTRQTLLAVNGYGFALSPDEKLLATGENTFAEPFLVYLWDAVTGRQLVTLTGHTAAVGGYAFSPDGNYLATGGDEGVARVWDLRAWRAAGEPAGATISQAAIILDCHSQTNYYGGINFSPDGKRLVTVCDKDNTAKVWDMPSGKLVFSLTGHTDYVSDADFSPDGQYLATTSVDGTARLWDAVTGQELLRLNPGKGTVLNLAFSPDGQYLATSSGAFAVVWNANTGDRLLDLPNPAGLMDLAFSPDGRRLVTTMSGVIQAWDVTSNGPGELANAPRQLFYDFNNNRDGSRFASINSDGRLSLYDSATLQELWATTQLFTGDIWGADGVSFSADNTLLSASVENTVTIWNTNSQQKLFDLVQADNVWEATLSPDGLRLAAGLDNGDIVIWDLATQKPLQTLSSTLNCISSIEFSPDGTRLAAGGSVEKPFCAGGGRVHIWDLAGGVENIPAPLELQFDNRAIYHLNFSPDGQRLAASGSNGATVWEWATGKSVLTMTAHTGYVNDINYSPDGKYLGLVKE